MKIITFDRIRLTRASLWLMLSIAVCGLVSPRNALACSCMETELEAAADAASNIFVGQILDITKNPLKPEYKEVKVKILRRIKGLENFAPKEILIYTANDSAMCGFNFLENVDYLIYTRGTLAKLTVDSCSRTQFFEKAFEEISDLVYMYSNDDEEVEGKKAEQPPAVEKIKTEQEVTAPQTPAKTPRRN